MKELAFSENVNFDKLANTDASYDTTIDPSYLPRLQESCVKILEPVQTEFKFYVDMQGLRTIEGRVKAKLSFICQRCQKEFVKEIESNFLSTCDEQKAKSLKIDEKLDIVELNEDGTFNLLAFLEDCLLLEIPYITSHEENDPECKEGNEWSFGKVEKSEDDNPFAKLASLKDHLKIYPRS